MDVSIIFTVAVLFSIFIFSMLLKKWKHLYGKIKDSLEGLLILINIVLNPPFFVFIVYPWIYSIDNGSIYGGLFLELIGSLISAVILSVITVIFLLLLKGVDFKLKKALFVVLISTVTSVIFSPILVPLLIYLGVILNCIFLKECGW